MAHQIEKLSFLFKSFVKDCRM